MVAISVHGPTNLVILIFRLLMGCVTPWCHLARRLYTLYYTLYFVSYLIASRFVVSYHLSFRPSGTAIHLTDRGNHPADSVTDRTDAATHPTEFATHRNSRSRPMVSGICPICPATLLMDTVIHRMDTATHLKCDMLAVLKENPNGTYITIVIKVELITKY